MKVIKNFKESKTFISIKHQSNMSKFKNIRQSYNKISNDLRKKIIHCFENDGISRRSIASKFNLPYGTVVSIYRRYILTGAIESRKKNLFSDTVLNNEQAKFVEGLLKDDSVCTRKELKQLFEDKYQQPLSTNTINEFMTPFNVIIKRFPKIVMPYITDKITQGRKTYCLFYKELICCGRPLIYVDEATFKISTRKVLENKIITKSCIKTVMASMTSKEVLYYKAFSGPSNETRLQEYLDAMLKLLQERSINEAVLIMNKTPSCHYDVNILKSFIQHAGHDVLFITPYTPSLNPVHIMFSHYNNLIKSQSPKNEYALEELVNSFEGMVSSEKCSEYCKQVLDNVTLYLDNNTL